jgi:hypothetical protein
LLCISDQGIQLLEELNPLIIERSKSAANLTEEEAETLSALLDKLRG